MSDCKHEPEQFGTILDQISGKVRCKHCFLIGHLSNGRRKPGRARKVYWRNNPLLSEESRYARPQP